MKFVRLALSGFAAALATLGVAQAQDKPAHLKIGTSLSQMPWGFYDEKHRPTGVDVALREGIAEQTGSTAEAVVRALRDALVAMKANGGYDAILKQRGIESAALDTFDK